MKKYKLLKDLPTAKAGKIFELRGNGLYDPEAERYVYSLDTLKKFDALDEWFEEIKKYKCWKPEQEEEYTYVRDDGAFAMTTYIRGNKYDQTRLETGNCFKEIKEAFIAFEKLKALRRLREKGLRFFEWEWDFPDDDILCIKARCKYFESLKKDLDLLFKEDE